MVGRLLEKVKKLPSPSSSKGGGDKREDKYSFMAKPFYNKQF